MGAERGLRSGEFSPTPRKEQCHCDCHYDEPCACCDNTLVKCFGRRFRKAEALLFDLLEAENRRPMVWELPSEFEEVVEQVRVFLEDKARVDRA